MEGEEGRGSIKQKGAVLRGEKGEGEGGAVEEEGSWVVVEGGGEGREEGVGVIVSRQLGQPKQTVAQAPFFMTSLPFCTTLWSSFWCCLGTPTNSPSTASFSLNALLTVPRSRRIWGRGER